VDCDCLFIGRCLLGNIRGEDRAAGIRQQANTLESGARILALRSGKYLPSYLSLWHKDFLGWSSISPMPLRRDHITDWITSQTSKGLTPKVVEFKPAEIQIIGDVAVLYYWLTFAWLDKDGKGAPRTLRVTHTWLKDGKDWRIIGGMSMPEAVNPQK
jgi:hypothetical protein